MFQQLVIASLAVSTVTTLEAAAKWPDLVWLASALFFGVAGAKPARCVWTQPPRNPFPSWPGSPRRSLSVWPVHAILVAGVGDGTAVFSRAHPNSSLLGNGAPSVTDPRSSAGCRRVRPGDGMRSGECCYHLVQVHASNSP